MRVTIIADASQCSETKVGGYGFWIVSRRGKYAGSGVFKGSVAGASEAEMMSMVNALHMSIALGIAQKGDDVLIQSDCMSAMALMQGRTRRVLPQYVSALERFRKLKADYSLKVEFRHVRGHTDTGDRRSAAQRLADQRARAQMRAARKALTKVAAPPKEVSC
jgi:ribonuclease HI